MNIYFLLEGRSTEKKVYSSWLQYMLPQLQKVNHYDEVEDNNYFLMSAHGYPSIIHEYIPDAINRMKEIGKYKYLVVCLDADEDTVDRKKEEIDNFIKTENIELGEINLIAIVQNRCIETWFLGNRKMFDSRQPLERPLSDYVNYYDVSVNDPELMGNYNEDYNHAEFHYVYLKKVFEAKNTSYTKKNPRDAQEKHFLERLIQRMKEDRNHLKSFQSFIEFCELINQQLSRSL